MTAAVDVEAEWPARVRRRGARGAGHTALVDNKGVDGARAALVDNQHASSLVELDLRRHAGTHAERLNCPGDRLQPALVVESEASDGVRVSVHDVHQVVMQRETGWTSATRRDWTANQAQAVLLDLESRNRAAAGVHDHELLTIV